jgi:formamidopyrimidine-DNA glycosylase
VPELPDIETYLACLRPRVVGQMLEAVRVVSPFLVRSVDPPIDEAQGRAIRTVSRLGKRLVFELDGDPPLFLVLHLMIAGRLRWAEPDARAAGKIALAAFSLPTGTLILTEAATRKRASVHVVRGRNALAQHNPGGLDVFEADTAAFAAALRRENHTLKRSLTDPRLLDGIGNAYSDEILHAARLSPVKLTQSLTDEEIARLHAAAQTTLACWRDRLIARFADRFPGPGDITAFRPEFAVHGKYGKPCPICGTAVQRIVHAESETNYCPRCQTGGKLLADRSLSRLLKQDWPATVEELEEMRRPAGPA